MLRRQRGQLRRGLNHLHREGFRTVHILRTPDEVADATITRTRLYSDLRHESGPFDCSATCTAAAPSSSSC